MTKQRIEWLETALQRAFHPVALQVIDESYLHVGHAAAGGAGHFRVKIVAAAFAGLSRVQRHQAVFAAVSDLLDGEVHALSIEAKTPAESST